MPQKVTYRISMTILGKASSATVHILSGYGKRLMIGLWTGAWAAFDLSGTTWRSRTTETPDLPGRCPAPCLIYTNRQGRQIRHI